MSVLPKVKFESKKEKAAFLFVYRNKFSLDEDGICKACRISRAAFDHWRYRDQEFTDYVTEYSRRYITELQPEVSRMLIHRLFREDAGIKDYELFYKLVNEFNGEESEEKIMEFKACFGTEK